MTNMSHVAASLHSTFLASFPGPRPASWAGREPGNLPMIQQYEVSENWLAPFQTLTLILSIFFYFHFVGMTGEPGNKAGNW